MTAVIKVIQAGLLATLQDFGRFGLLARGITCGGPMDERSFLWANRILGNHFNSAQIEVTAGGFKAQILNDAVFAVTGQSGAVLLNQQLQSPWRSFAVRAGDELVIQPGQHGLRSYLAVAGGFSGAAVYNSVATVMRDGLGGLHGDGRPIATNDILYAAQAEPPSSSWSRTPHSNLIPRVTDRVTLDIAAVAQHEQFSPAMHKRLVQQEYTASSAQDRMGVRLDGHLPISWEHEQIISEPLPVGAVQIPPDGQPIVMMKDRQTLGGYPKIGVLSWSGICALAQAGPGTKIHFNWIPMTQAVQELQRVYRFFGVHG